MTEGGAGVSLATENGAAQIAGLAIPQFVFRA
jgi:hypothetical protein